MSDEATEVQKERKKESSFGSEMVSIAYAFAVIAGLLFVLWGYGIAIIAYQEAHQTAPTDTYQEKTVDAVLMISLGFVIVAMAIWRIVERANK